MSEAQCGATARLLVQISSSSTPALQRHCPRCKARRSFVSSGKFRVNAQKKRIDAWLIFRCTACDDRWNWPVWERRAVATLDPSELDALMRNDPDLALRHARSTAAGPTQEASVTLIIEEPATADTRRIEILIAGAGMRLDRLLARALMLGRREIEAMDEAGAIIILPQAARKALRRPAMDRQRLAIELTACSEETAAHLRQRASAQLLLDRYC